MGTEDGVRQCSITENVLIVAAYISSECQKKYGFSTWLRSRLAKWSRELDRTYPLASLLAQVAVRVGTFLVSS